MFSGTQMLYKDFQLWDSVPLTPRFFKGQFVSGFANDILLYTEKYQIHTHRNHDY